MKKVLVYGDSNVFGETAFCNARLNASERWAGMLAEQFADSFEIIAEGFSGRTAGNLQHGAKAAANGREHFETVYSSHKPVDILMIALGTNDLKRRFNRSAAEIVDDLTWYTEHVHTIAAREAHAPVPRVVYCTIPPFQNRSDFFMGDEAVRVELNEYMVESKLECIELDDISLTEDGVHFSSEGHKMVARAVGEWLKVHESTGDAFHVRLARSEDARAIGALMKQSWRDTYPNEEYDVSRDWVHGYTHDWTDNKRIEMRRTFIEASANAASNDRLMFVAENDRGEIIGMANPTRDETEQRVGALYVATEYHGSGAAHALMRKILDWADPNRDIMLQVAVYNKRAIRFYEKYQFKEIPGSNTLLKEKIPVITMKRKGERQ